MIPNVLLVFSLIIVLPTSLLGQGSNNDSTVRHSDISISYSSPERLRIGRIRVDGASNFDQNAVKVIAGLQEGMIVHIPGDEIATAIRNLWNEELFSDVDIS
ncbi:MAG: hypothetical protein COA38_11775, partial [Fluviicola sp.]